MAVVWLLAARESLRKALHGQPVGPAGWLGRIDAELGRVFPGQLVIVRDRYSGYRPFGGIVILLVEVQPPADGGPSERFPSPGTYIVKLAFDGRRGELKAEIDAWNAARPAHLRHDNVFVSLEAHPHAADPTALVYGDAAAVLGERNVMSLEDAVARACRFGVPRPASVARCLRSLYERLNTHFFEYAHLEPGAAALGGPRPDLGGLLARFDENAPTDTGHERADDPARRQHRREVLALLADRHEHYADPADVLAGMRAAGVGPAVLRGHAHGDLHGRNVHVAVDHDEVGQCAVYDYEKFGTDNLVAWDFIKLEVETAVRLLAEFGDNDTPRFVAQCLLFWRNVAARTDAHERRTSAPLDPSLCLPGGPWDRLADLIVDLRMVAAENLGSDRGRTEGWLAEYEFLLAWYAARAALYPNYAPRLCQAALVAAGVAARRTVRRLPAGVELGHRRRLDAARTLARGADRPGIAAAAVALKELAAEFRHVLEIEDELALAHIKLGEFDAAEAILTAISERYLHTSAETPARLGSLWKRRAFAGPDVDRRALEQALKWYTRAVARHPDNYYVRVNVATLLLVRGRVAEAQAEARIAGELLDKEDAADFWHHATRGEVLLLLGGAVAAALDHYRRAVRDRSCQPQDGLSMRTQIVFLRPHLPADVRELLADDVLETLFVHDPETTA